MLYNPYDFKDFIINRADWGKPRFFGASDIWTKDGFIYYCFYVFYIPIYKTIGVHSTTFID